MAEGDFQIICSSFQIHFLNMQFYEMDAPLNVLSVFVSRYYL